MQIRNSSKNNLITNFKGHEAKKLHSILVHQNNNDGSEAIFKDLTAIATQHKVKVEKIKYFDTTWIQDKIYFTPNKKVVSDNANYSIYYANKFGVTPDILKRKNNNYAQNHIDGGNIFFVTDKEGNQVILTAKNTDGSCELNECENIFNAKKVIALPRTDYHADLFITPIGNNKILVANDELMLEGLYKILEACVFYVIDNPTDKDCKEIEKLSCKILELMDSFTNCIENYNFKDSDKETLKILSDNGFEVIPVPSRIYNFNKWKNSDNNEYITHLLNYSNAITFKNEANETILITGKSYLEKKLGFTDEIIKKIGIDFEMLFKESLSPHIKPNNVYFISGDSQNPISKILEEKKGGLHCMCVEVPEFSDK